MLYYNSITPQTLELLNNIFQHNEFSKLRLVGGTSLALQIGHRTSIDIDLFGNIDINPNNILDSLSVLGKIQLISLSKSIITCTINNIKTDIVNYQYPWLEKALTFDTLTLAHPKDIAAMKLSAITGRGSMKDFIDLYFLLQKYTLSEMLDFYEQKYTDGSKILVLKSLTYFDDADNDVKPKLFNKINWQEIKNEIIHQVKIFSKNI